VTSVDTILFNYHLTLVFEFEKKKIVLQSMKTAYPSSRMSDLQIPCSLKRENTLQMHADYA